MEENAFDMLNHIKNEADVIGEDKNHIFNATDKEKFIETYLIELISFYNERYKEYENISFRNIKPYIKHIKIKKNFILELDKLSKSEIVDIVKRKNSNLATLIENTDIANRIIFPADVTDENLLSTNDYIKDPLSDALNIYDIKTLTDSSKSLFVIPPESEFINIFFGKKQLMFDNYFDATDVNPFNKTPIRIIGDDKEIYRKAEVIPPESAVSIDNLALYHKKTKKRSIENIVKVYKDFYNFITDPEKYLMVRNTLYKYVKLTYPDLCH